MGEFNTSNMSDRNPDKKPFFCPVCESPMGSSIAIEAYKRVGACDLCETYFYYLEREKWEEGWRPSVRDARAYLSKRGVNLLDIPESDDKL